MNSGNTAQSGSDNRYFPRWAVNNRVTYKATTPHSQYHQAQTKDLSCSGACILSSHKLSENQKLKLTIELGGGTNIQVVGTIAWIKPAVDNLHQVGVNFYEISDQAQAQILEHAFEVDPNQLRNHWFKGWSGN